MKTNQTLNVTFYCDSDFISHNFDLTSCKSDLIFHNYKCTFLTIIISHKDKCFF